jgi:hypothetical protein
VRSFTVSAAGVFAALLDWGVLTWIVLLAGITAWRSVGPARPRTGLSVAAAAIGAAVSLGFLAIPSIGPSIGAGWDSLMLYLPQQIVRAGAVLAGGAIGALAAAAILRSPARPIHRRVLIGGGFAVVVFAVTLVITLFWQYLDVYTSMAGSILTPTPAQRSRYVATAALAIVVPLLAVIIGGVLRARSLFASAVALTILAFIVVVVWQVPESPPAAASLRQDPPSGRHIVETIEPSTNPANSPIFAKPSRS